MILALRPRGHLWQASLSLALAALLVLPQAAAASGTQLTTSRAAYWPVFARSPQVRSTQTLFWVVIGLCFVILAIVEVALVIFIFRFRERPGQIGEPPQIYQNKKLELWWTLIPALMLLGVFVYMVPTMNGLLSIPNNALPITITGHQWWWQVDYTSLGVNTAEEIHVPAGRPLRFTLVSADVVHNFWIPVLGGKEQLIPGITNTWNFTPDRPGVYDGECSEYCGVGHAWMRLKLVAQPLAQFNAWVAAQRAPANPLTTPRARQAAGLFEAEACSQCHTIRGLSQATGIV
ncbi:MAG: cytochrome c oxidase subunit II, partial [Chloroflexota bacterium]